MFRWVAGIVFLMVSLCCQALNDPTRPSSYKAVTSQSTPLKLESILWSDQRKVAVISGKALTEGESSGSIKVVRIERDKVVVRKHGKNIELVPERATIKREK